MSTTNMIAEPASVHGSPHTIGKAEAAAQTVRSRIIAAPSLDALYRAALTFCIDGADAMMYATLKGAEHAEALWQVLSQCHPDRPSDVRQKALTCIDRMFINGLTRWGRKPTPSAMNAFRNALSGWHQRMDALPSQDIVSLADWFTMDGTQWIIGPGHPCWPAQLTDLSIRSDWAPPLCLWVKGDPRALTSCAKPVGIVGSRDVNEYGRYVAHTVAEQAAVDGHLVVSGGAMGTDAAAHWGALNALHGRKPGCVGRTVAVFAGGLNHMGPARNRTLFERIESQGGALISELCPGTIPEARRFLLRNRIIAALSSTLVVAQARLRSGALNTAGWACELMREVYAVPGDINQPCNAGCNKMIGTIRPRFYAPPPPRKTSVTSAISRLWNDAQAWRTTHSAMPVIQRLRVRPRRSTRNPSSLRYPRLSSRLPCRLAQTPRISPHPTTCQICAPRHRCSPMRKRNRRYRSAHCRKRNA